MKFCHKVLGDVFQDKSCCDNLSITVLPNDHSRHKTDYFDEKNIKSSSCKYYFCLSLIIFIMFNIQTSLHISFNQDLIHVHLGSIFSFRIEIESEGNLIQTSPLLSVKVMIGLRSPTDCQG